MTFQDFIDSGMVRKGSPDIQLCRALVSMSQNHLSAIQRLELTEVTSSTIMMAAYEALREIVEAIGIKEGYKAYSHEALTFFLKEKGEERLAGKFDRFRKIRNSINYYGKSVDAASVHLHIEEIPLMIKELREKFLKGVL